MHQEWCGPCEAIGPTLQRMFTDYDNADSRMKLASASFTSDQSATGGQPTSVSPLGQKIQAIIPHDARVNLETHGCLPLFLVLRVSFYYFIILSSNCFMLCYDVSIQFKTCVGVTIGVDAPTLLQQITLNIPDYKPKEEDN